MYIKCWKGSPLCLELSVFKQTETQEQTTQQDQGKAHSTPRSSIVQNIANMGINVTSLNNAPIKLDALEISNIYGSSADVSG